jgi:hypothetical protein
LRRLRPYGRAADHNEDSSKTATGSISSRVNYRMGGVLDNRVISIADVVRSVDTASSTDSGGDSATWLLGFPLPPDRCSVFWQSP